MVSGTAITEDQILDLEDAVRREAGAGWVRAEPLAAPGEGDEAPLEKQPLVPPLSAKDYEALKADIAERGCVVPVEVDEDGEVLDGAHRIRACDELTAEGATVKPDYVVRTGLSPSEKRDHTRALNMVRRHLSRKQRQSMIESAVRETPERSNRMIGSALGVHHQTVQAAREKLEARGEIRHVSVREDTLGRKQPVKKRPRIYAEAGELEKLKKVGLKGVDLPDKRIDPRRVLNLARVQQVRERAEKEPAPDPAGDVDVELCDLSELDVEDVDLLFTDPPYLKEYLPEWDKLAKFSGRVLRPGRLLIAYSGQYYLPAVMDSLAAHLEYVWLGSIVMPGGVHAVHHAANISIGSKPLLFYSSGEYEVGTWFDDTTVSEGAAKSHHDWEQSIGAARYYIERLTKPGDLVCDPFLGSGTSGVAAHELGRRFVGCDVDPVALDTAKRRLNDVKGPAT